MININYLDSTIKTKFKNYLCVFCKGLVYKARFVDNLGIFCSDCLFQSIQNQEIPFEKLTLCKNAQLLPKLDEEISRLVTRCRNTPKGCFWTGMVNKIEAHLTDCQFEPTECPAVDCKKVMAKFKLKEHLKLCNNSTINCPNGQCMKLITRKMQAFHNANECRFHLVQCVNTGCREMIQKRKLWFHANQCPFRRNRYDFQNTYDANDTYFDPKAFEKVVDNIYAERLFKPTFEKLPDLPNESSESSASAQEQYHQFNREMDKKIDYELYCAQNEENLLRDVKGEKKKRRSVSIKKKMHSELRECGYIYCSPDLYFKKLVIEKAARNNHFSTIVFDYKIDLNASFSFKLKKVTGFIGFGVVVLSEAKKKNFKFNKDDFGGFVLFSSLASSCNTFSNKCGFPRSKPEKMRDKQLLTVEYDSVKGILSFNYGAEEYEMKDVKSEEGLYPCVVFSKLGDKIKIK